MQKVLGSLCQIHKKQGNFDEIGKGNIKNKAQR